MHTWIHVQLDQKILDGLFQTQVLVPIKCEHKNMVMMASKRKWIFPCKTHQADAKSESMSNTTHSRSFHLLISFNFPFFILVNEAMKMPKYYVIFCLPCKAGRARKNKQTEHIIVKKITQLKWPKYQNQMSQTFFICYI